MISIPLFFYILFLHYLGDFVLQPYWMSVQKSESYKVLFYHIFIYSLTIYIGLLLVVDIKYAIKFSIISGVLHYFIDFFTSKIISDNSLDLELDPDEKKPMYKRLKLWAPITLLGFDQLLHQACLLIACYILT